MAQLSEAASIRRLFDRYGFGAGGVELADAQQRGWSATREALLDPNGPDAGVESTPPPELTWSPRPPGAAPGSAELKAWRQASREQLHELTWWWLSRMVATRAPLRERMTWLWHGHFATSSQKVHGAALMYEQNATLRAGALGPFAQLAQAMAVDPAMLLWLDGNDNAAQAPNENLSREFMELFSLGPGHYTETDVKEAARALTGWVVDRRSGTAEFRPRRHDDRPKTVLGTTSNLDAAAFVDLVLGQPASARFVVGRVWFRLVGPDSPGEPTLRRLVTAYGARGDLTALLRAITAEPAFRAESTSLVKSPVEWLVGLLRALDVSPADLPPQQANRLLALLRAMGQVPFSPPSVGGWPAGASWLTTAATLSRAQAARFVATVATLPASASTTSQRHRPEYIRRLLGVDRFSTRTQQAVAAVADRLPAAVAVAACSPEYVVSA